MKNIFFLIVCFIYAGLNAQTINLEAKAIELGVDRISKIGSTKIYRLNKNELYGFADENFSIIIPCENDYNEFVGNHYLRIRNSNGKYSLFDMSLKKYVQKDKHYISIIYTITTGNTAKSYFSSSNLVEDDTIIYDLEGKTIANIKDYSISMHGGNEYGIIMLENGNGSNFKMLNEFGKEIASFDYIYCPYKDRDYFYVRKDSNIYTNPSRKYGIINHEGKELLKLNHDKITFQEESIIITLKDKITVLDRNLKLKFNLENAINADGVRGNTFLAQYPNNKWKVIDADGRTLFKVEAKKVESYPNNLFKVENQNTSYFVNMEGKTVSAE
ncbi:hypothetical protein [Flavobacterium reichenbachii]|uniref:WG repeat-containing protein n=1 Tax=Flavobacterium reichenbachii TaxID=362418 RepID=A0A085ZNZ6_9FLAO|nr:hypothetical protein [Flavobacterium reichenbachii]KFF06160.1 hypothetical protein IW19_11735 [Flavobacterium reichenbachii]OXB17619.1 hypothetical protein B0A68_04835 [Flavobacterium reichenbachii]